MSSSVWMEEETVIFLIVNQKKKRLKKITLISDCKQQRNYAENQDLQAEMKPRGVQKGAVANIMLEKLENRAIEWEKERSAKALTL